ncbi:MAG: quinoprotein relay system zinc metallohydrolase 2 [Azospirillum sp.]|nr:quinoprotein relay system zinc metallohydrolase 2 [Azospirillum sp.]
MAIGRRRFLLAVAAGAVIPAAPALAVPFAISEIAPGVFVHHGQYALPNPENRGDIANCGFVVGGEAVAVIDSGGGPAIGRALRAAIAAHTDRPIRYLINTHCHFDHVFGNGAFLADHPALVGHRSLEAALKARADLYLARFTDYLGAGAADEVLFFPTDRPVADRDRLDLGGRVLELWAHPAAHSNSDLTVFDPATATLWAGDLVFSQHVPVLDGSILGWLRVMDALAELPAARAIGGHAPVSLAWPAGLTDQRRYLETVVAEIRALQAARGTIEHAVATVGLGERARWQMFETYHRRTVTAAFAELEWA